MTEQPLGDLLEVIIDHRGKTPKKLGGTDFTDAGVPVVSAIHIKNGRINWEERLRFAPQWMFEKWMPVRLKKGDVLLTSEAPLGEVAQVETNEPLVLSQRLFALRGKPGLLDSTYLRYFLQSSEGQTRLLTRASGTTVFGIRQAELVKILVPVQPFDEQRRIAGVLGAFDDLIDTNHGLVGRLEALLAAVFDEEGFDSDSGDGLLGDVISVNPFYRKPTGVAPYVDMAAIPTQGARVSAVGSRKAAGGARFTSGDTLLARITPCLENGKTAFVDFLDTDEVGVGSTEFIVLRDQTGVSQHWPYFLARSERFRSYAIRHMTGTSGRQRCPAEAVARYPLAAPEREDLRRFERLAEPLFAAMRQLDAESAELTRTRDEFLPLLMSGRITVDEAWEALP